MSKRPFDTLQPKITRNDRFAQMSNQERIIEQKKREIQAKLDAKQKTPNVESKEKNSTDAAGSSAQLSKISSSPKPDIDKTPNLSNNMFSNDGSFLDQFKLLKEKKVESKIKPYNKSKEYGTYDKNYSDRNRWKPRQRSPSPKTKRPSRFSLEKYSNFEPKITINASFSSQNFSMTEPQVQHHQNSQQVSTPTTSQFNTDTTPLLKNLLPSPNIVYPTTVVAAPQPPEIDPVITASPVLLNVPPPQFVQGPLSSLVLTPQTQNVLVTTPVLTTMTIPSQIIGQNLTVTPNTVLPVPPPCIPTVELASIPPPNPIQIHNIPQPEPINTLNIPPPAPLQLHSIPTPTSLQLNEIPNPKPLDLLAIPTPNEGNAISDPDFIKNFPPPNKSVPPPSQTAATLVQMAPPSQNVILHSVTPSVSQQSSFSISIIQNNPVPTSQIPSLMAQPILPPPGMNLSGNSLNLSSGNVNIGGANVNMGGSSLNIGGVSMNMNCPPPILPPVNSSGNLTQRPPSFVTQPPPITSQMPPMNVPPPGMATAFRDVNPVFPTGTPEFEAMSSLAQMVAECGPSIEQVVKEKKNRDPKLWFLFQKDSPAYAQYQALVEKYQHEKEEKAIKPDPEDMYEPEMALEDDFPSVKSEMKQEFPEYDSEFNNSGKRKRRSRWGNKEANVPPPQIVLPPNTVNPLLMSNLMQPGQQGSPMLSKVTRTNPGLLQYTMNTYGSTNLSEEDWKKAEDNYKIHLLYQDMVRKREELEKLEAQGKKKYEYDSDEDTEGGTWEHKLREKEMMATELWAQELNKQAEGKHHIGDFLPPEELKRFLEKSNAVKEGRQPNFSDYKEFKIKEDNIGFKMLQKLGWTEGESLGSTNSGIVEPVNKGAPREHTQGLGLNLNDAMEGEDEYDSYRKRMMLAYRFRPNPLNNPRRPYY